MYLENGSESTLKDTQLYEQMIVGLIWRTFGTSIDCPESCMSYKNHIVYIYVVPTPAEAKPFRRNYTVRLKRIKL